MSILRYLVSAVPLLAGCAAAEESDEQVGTATGGITVSCANAYTHYTSSNGSNVQLRPDSSNFCWLTRVSGNFNADRGNHMAWVERGPIDGLAGGYWWLRTSGSGVYASATCVPIACYTAGSDNEELWISGTFNAIATADAGCASGYQNTWWGDAATILQGFGGPGAAEGSRENTSVTQSTSATTSSQIRANDCKRDGLGGWIRGFANSLFNGTPNSGQVLDFQGPNPPNGGPYATVGEYALSSTGSNLYRWQLLALSAYNYCYLAKVGGDFNGGGEVVKLDIQNDSEGQPRWRLFVQHESGDGIHGIARCSPYHQPRL